jgi:protein transport protein SEC61 subunit gamma-like protein
VVAPALRLDSLTNARVVVVGVTRPLPRRAPQASRLNAPDTMEVADIAVKPVKEFAKDSYRLVRKCTKPDRKEFSKIATRTGLGFIVMGFVGFFVKLILYVCRARFLTILYRVHPRRRTRISRIRPLERSRVSKDHPPAASRDRGRRGR